MRVNMAQAIATPPSLSSPHNASPSPTPNLRLHRSLSSPLTLSRSKSTAHNRLRRSCSATFDGRDFTPQHHNTHHLTTTSTTSFSQSDSHHVDVLEPSMLGIRPEPPDWPARDAVIRDCIARRASSIDLPLSLRMIKMKQKFMRLEEEREIGDLEESLKDNPVNNLCCSTLYIIREVQSQALKSRGMVLDEDLEGIVSKVQREMTSSFAWLFKEVFAKTPDLMLQVMVLTSNFAAHSLESFHTLAETQEISKEGEELEQNSRNWGIGYLELGKLEVPTREIFEGMEESEVGLWNTMVKEANHIQGGHVKDEGLGFVVDDNHHDHKEQKIEFVSPVRVEIEKDDYEEYYRTDLLYQISLFQDPNNTLLLSNYAQFLCLVSRDFDRAEMFFKRAIQVDPTNAEVMSQYANFLWIVREDIWGAEERFQQAIAAEPNNSYHASKYANFLWNTGGEDTCYPLDPPPCVKS